MIEPVTDSKLTCPECAHQELLAMPTDACLWFHQCSGCGVLLKPLVGDCCVFCSYGSVPCPPIQIANGAGGTCCG